jgi:prolyl oligopeptidase
MTRALLPLALMLCTPAFAGDDDLIWLEDVTGERSMEWVKARNAESTAALSSEPGFDALKERLRGIYDSTDRIPYVSKQGEYFYNFWRDGEHPKGIWRRTTLASYRTDKPEWDVIIDVDALGEAEGESWVWDGASCLRPTYERCLVALSRGGADATVTREFDVPSRSFVDGGFALPEAKGSLRWIDIDHVYASTDFGEGTLTDSGYPRQVKRWTRGTPLADAKLEFEGDVKDVSVSAWHDDTVGFEGDYLWRGTTFFTNQMYVLKKGEWVKLDKPDSAVARSWRGWLLFELRDDWEIAGKTYKAGSLLATDQKKWLKGKRAVQVLFEPTERTSLSSFTGTRNHLILNVLDNVKNSLSVLTPGKKAWTRAPLPGVPEYGTVGASAVDPDEGDAFFLTVSDYLSPSSLAYGTIGGAAPETLKSLPALFDASGLTVSQHMATSKDGTKIPYFQVAPDDMPLDGSTPTLLYGYGGFEVSLLPYYSSSVGASWLEKGGVYVVANIRGGGEFGPRWHQAALKEKRHKAYEDFIAVGEDLIARKVTTPAHLGIMGGSNGGLLMGNMYTMRPDLWGAVVCRVPLLDMRRYHTLLAGASWMGEYGDPDDPEQWAFIKGFSPYHNIDAATDYPPMLITTSTRDDRVHPGHARKMAARLHELGITDTIYYENIEGGHGGAANNEQRAFMDAMGWTFLWKQLAAETAEGTAAGGAAAP